ncbi:hypothetical protein C0J52_04219 [Blattella germanica]|nr:hypothetical protein C0J52_04219 [Blattella germanica]
MDNNCRKACITVTVDTFDVTCKELVGAEFILCTFVEKVVVSSISVIISVMLLQRSDFNKSQFALGMKHETSSSCIFRVNNHSENRCMLQSHFR